MNKHKLIILLACLALLLAGCGAQESVPERVPPAAEVNLKRDGELHTLDELVALDPLMADFKAVKSGNVWCLTKNFYQESLELSDLILDVNHALNDAPDTAFHFLTRMK